MSFAPQTFQSATRVPQTFSELLATYQEKKRDSEIDLTGEVDFRTRPGLELRKNGATQALPGLKEELGRLVEQNSAAIFLSGPADKVEEFVGLAQDATEGNIVVVSAKEMYTKLAKGVEGGLRSDRRFSMDTINSFVYAILKLFDELNINDPLASPNLVRYLNQIFPDTESVSTLVRDALASVQTSGGQPAGDGLNSLYLSYRVTEEAIREEVATDFLPVVVLDATPEEASGALKDLLFFGRNVSVALKGEVDANTVVTAFKELKKKNKNRGPR